MNSASGCADKVGSAVPKATSTESYSIQFSSAISLCSLGATVPRQKLKVFSFVAKHQLLHFRMPGLLDSFGLWFHFSVLMLVNNACK